MSNRSNSNVTIGLEVHAQITSLKTKLFCSCPSDYRGKPPNTNVCPVCLGLPGALPVTNAEAIRAAIMVALALRCTVSDTLVFTRKHYFYPDLPKNYQISQYNGVGGMPIARGGYIIINVDGNVKRVRIRRVNIEEDPGRLVYPTGALTTSKYTLVDYNRAGVALLEIVTEPDLSSPREARVFVDKVRSILEHLGVTDPNLEGSIRVDANISLAGGSRVEIKNISSPRDVEKALAYEIIRQTKILEGGEAIRRETRHWDNVRRVTVSLRMKEFEEDYRYFPDPDLPPVEVSRELVEEIASKLPELPDQRVERFLNVYRINEYLANVLVLDKGLADYFEECVRICSNPELIGNLVINDLRRWIDELDLSVHELKKIIPANRLCQLTQLLLSNSINIKILKEVISRALRTGKDALSIVYDEGYVDISDEAYLLKVVDEVFNENPRAVRDALENPRAVNYLVGQVMKRTKGRANPIVTNKLVIKRLNELKGR